MADSLAWDGWFGDAEELAFRGWFSHIVVFSNILATSAGAGSTNVSLWRVGPLHWIKNAGGMDWGRAVSLLGNKWTTPGESPPDWRNGG